MTDSEGRISIWARLGGRLPIPLAHVFKYHVQPHLPDASFVTLHYLYFIVSCLVASIIFWGSSTPSASVSYTDSLFLAVSAMTEAGLNTVNLSTLNTWQQVMLFLLIMMGSAIFVSSGILHVRKRAFENRLEELAERRQKHMMRLSSSFTFSRSRRKSDAASEHSNAVAAGAVRGRVIKDATSPTGDVSSPDAHAEWSNQPSRRRLSTHRTATDSDLGEDDVRNAHIRFEDMVSPDRESKAPDSNLNRHHSKLFAGSGVGARTNMNHPRNARPPLTEEPSREDVRKRERTESWGNGSISKIDKYLKTFDGYIGRNSQFHNLSEKERKKLGGIEYDAVCLLSWVVPMYFVLWQLLGAIGVGAWLQVNRPHTSLTNGLNPFWTGAFFAVSAFNNSGMALLDANAVALQTSVYSLLTLSLLILAGNTCFPPFLRLILWLMKKAIPGSYQSPQWQKRRKTLGFILDHPRRVYTNLFPSRQTWWLVTTLVVLNGTDWIAFEILNIGNPTTDAIPAHFRVLDGLFQAFAVRSGGFYVVSISGLRSGLLVLYVLMMYISALPVAMTIRNTNVYEERSLGIFAEDRSKEEAEEQQNKDRGVMGGLRRRVTGMTGNTTQTGSWTRQDFLRQQLRGQLGHDLWWIALAILFITIIETGQFEKDPVTFATFNIIFEVVSAYGCVGISTGVPWNAYSFCGAWHTGSKLILCAVMLRGRHRGLPVAIDKAVLLPSETLAWAEEEDAQMRIVSRKRTGMAEMEGNEKVTEDDGKLV